MNRSVHNSLMDTSTDKLAQARKNIANATSIIAQSLAVPADIHPQAQMLASAIQSLAHADAALVEAGRRKIGEAQDTSGAVAA